ncbi:MAG: NADH-quinone oxidoreductase subunit NuoF [Candidatus Sulfobium sp.]
MERPLTRNIVPGREPMNISEYEKAGGYRSVRKVLKGMAPKEIQEEVKKSNLRGRGGAGFSTGMKWNFVPMGDDAPRPKYIVVNADEMEPGTFKDRLLLEGNPHGMIEAVIVAAYAIQADIGYIFLRWAYKVAAKRLRKAIAEAYEKNYLGENILGSGYSLDLHLHVSAGRYMCGEETGLLNALEGRRAIPRAKPPYPQVSGLWGKPTVVNNVESFYNVPHIINNGAEWFKGLSRSEDGGTKLYGVSGNVNKPGLWELPMATTAREVLEEHAGGMRDGFKFRGLIPGGASTDFLVEEHLDIKLDFDTVPKYGSRLGTGTMIILDDRTCPVGMVLNLSIFFARESCGWCTPCREGLPWIVKILSAMENGEGREGDIENLERHCKLLGPGNTFCALAPGAVEPLQSAIKYFREDFERHIRGKGCPWKRRA